MKKIIFSFKFLMFAFWSIFHISMYTISNDLKGIYVYGIIGSFPLSYMSERIIIIFHLKQTLLIIFLIGSIQWIIIGYFIDILISKYKGNKK